MLNNNHKNSSCAFAEHLVSYLYGEIAGSEKIEFETHLENCSGCADELAGFGLVRSSILDWRKEFSAIEMPAFVLPEAQARQFSETVSIENHSWFGEIRKLFSFTPTWAAGAGAVLAVCVGLTLLAINFSGNGERAGNDLKDVNSGVVSPTVEKKTQPPEKADKKGAVEKSTEYSSNSGASKPGDLADKAPATTKNDPAVPNNSAVKISSGSRNSAFEEKSSQSPNDSAPARANQDGGIKKSPSVKARKAPKLVEDEDDEDDSLRLADLFEEIGAK